MSEVPDFRPIDRVDVALAAVALDAIFVAEVVLNRVDQAYDNQQTHIQNLKHELQPFQAVGLTLKKAGVQETNTQRQQVQIKETAIKDQITVANSKAPTHIPRGELTAGMLGVAVIGAVLIGSTSSRIRRLFYNDENRRNEAFKNLSSQLTKTADKAETAHV